MQATATYSQHSNDYPPFLSYMRNHHCLNDPIRTDMSFTNSNPTHLLPYNDYNIGLDLSSSSSSYSNGIKQLASDDENDNHQSLSCSLNGTTQNSLIPLKRRSRRVATEEKDETYYQKRERNNQAAKRSRDTRRTREQQIQDRVSHLENEKSRLSLENQAFQYQLSQFHRLYNGIPKPLP
ncbi:unnamed protein product [Adineta steineri]|uniref:BZIP domain-containing protein n=1 Tax=Adineta steineri TaxID=433720 RepID=A0A815QNG4_9BILA|nr:unnamed protein product [Adineta steineri]